MQRKLRRQRSRYLIQDIEVEKTKVASKIHISSVDMLSEARLEESRLVEEKVEALARSGANSYSQKKE